MSRQTIPVDGTLPSTNTNSHLGSGFISRPSVQDAAVTMLNEHAAALDTVELTSLFIFRGAGSPEGAVTAAVGSLYLSTDGGANTTLYVKESGAGNTGWIAK